MPATARCIQLANRHKSANLRSRWRNGASALFWGYAAHDRGSLGWDTVLRRETTP